MLFKILLAIHIVTGFLSLTTGTINIIGPKGKSVHKKVGTIFVYSMIMAGISALIMAILHPNHFLFIVGVFSLYMTISGKRYISRKFYNLFDYLITVFILLAAISFAIVGGLLLFKSQSFGIVMVVFSFISFSFVYNDYQNIQYKIIRSTTIHLQRIIGAYIASFTAFLVVNAKYLPQFIPGYVYWLLPTIIFTPVIIWFSKKYTTPKQSEFQINKD